MVRRTLIAALLVATISLPHTPARTIARNSGVEEALGHSKIVVLGKVVATPVGDLEHFEINDRPEYVFSVESYFVGSGPQYLTFGSRYDDLCLGLPGVEGLSPHEQKIAKGFAGVDMLMFLRHASVGVLCPSTATHGVVWVKVGSDGERTVTLLFKDPRFMPQETRQAYEAGRKRGAKKADLGYLGVVGVDELQKLFDRMSRVQSPSETPE